MRFIHHHLKKQQYLQLMELENGAQHHMDMQKITLLKLQMILDGHIHWDYFILHLHIF